MANDYKVIWSMLRKVSDVELQKAYEFYMKSPDGQYDLLAAQCIKAVQLQRQQDGGA
jgi:hypothetical protein